MDLSLASLWEWTKLFVRDPRMAATLVKEAKLPVEVSILMIVLAGVVSTAAGSLRYLIIGSPQVLIPISDVEAFAISPLGPIAQGLFAVVVGVGLAYSIFWVGERSDGKGSLADILSVMAVLQLVATVIGVAEVVASLVVPVFGLMLTILTLYVFFRGLGHAVNVGHGYDDMGKSVRIIIVSILVLCAIVFVLLVVLAIMGVSPQGEIVPLPEDLTL